MNAKIGNHAESKHLWILGSCVILIAAALFVLMAFGRSPASASTMSAVDPDKKTPPAVLELKTRGPKPTLIDFAKKTPSPTAVVTGTTSLPPTAVSSETTSIPAAGTTSPGAVPTPTPTVSTSAEPEDKLVLTLAPRKTFIVPGETVTLTLTVTNGNRFSTKIRLKASDSNPAFFTSVLDRPTIVLAPGETATRYVTVRSSPDAADDIRNTTRILEMIRGVSRVRARVVTEAGPGQLAVTHFRIGRDTPLDNMHYRAATDKPPKKIPRFRAFRVRFQVVNPQHLPARWQPRLEWGTRAHGIFQQLGVGAPEMGSPFYIYPQASISNGAAIAIENFGMVPQDYTVQPGMGITAQNPAPVFVLNASTLTEIEFSVRATVDARYRKKYFFRLSDDGRALKGPAAKIIMAPRPKTPLTQPQYSGIPPNVPKKANRAELPRRGVGEGDPHVRQSVVDANCAMCHRSHTAQNRNLLKLSEPQSNLCFTCHDGSQAIDIKSQFSDPNVPPNVPDTSTFYSHPATTASAHTQAAIDEFKNVLNRHTECGDCHNPHRGNKSRVAATAKGYTVSGAELLITGVRAKQSRALVWRRASKYEYELCYKCHSSYTILLSYSKPSRQMTDVAADFDPANPSFHPIESAGKNTSTTIANNLAGTSPYKLWNFEPGDVVRCVNCHGDYRRANPAAPPRVKSRLAPHTSENRGILMNNYRDRELKPRNEPYSAADFALCYQCHTEAPYVDSSGAPRGDTGFRFHGFHLNEIETKGNGGVKIDVAGAGQGNALCAECHFRPHGQDTNARGNPSGQRLVNFAPNVQPNGSGVLEWDATSRKCTVACHGQEHNGWGY